MYKNIYIILIDLDDILYSILRMLLYICTQSPFPLLSHHFCLSNILCIHLLYMQLAVIFIFMCITLLYGADVLS